MSMVQRRCGISCYVDDGIQISMRYSDIDIETRILQSKGFKIEDQGHPNNYVAVNILKTDDRQYVFSPQDITSSLGLTTTQSSSLQLQINCGKIQLFGTKYTNVQNIHQLHAEHMETVTTAKYLISTLGLAF